VRKDEEGCAAKLNAEAIVLEQLLSALARELLAPAAGRGAAEVAAALRGAARILKLGEEGAAALADALRGALVAGVSGDWDAARARQWALEHDALGRLREPVAATLAAYWARERGATRAAAERPALVTPAYEGVGWRVDCSLDSRREDAARAVVQLDCTAPRGGKPAAVRFELSRRRLVELDGELGVVEAALAALGQSARA
jgi:hypothetical protein